MLGKITISLFVGGLIIVFVAGFLAGEFVKTPEQITGCPVDMNYQVAYATNYAQPFAPLQDANYISALMQSGYMCDQDQQTGIVLCAESVRTEVGYMCIKKAS